MNEAPDAQQRRHSFRVVGGPEAALGEVPQSAAVRVSRVAVTSIRKGRFLVVPIREEPVDGRSLNEDGYTEVAACGRVSAFFGPNAYLSEVVWRRALSAISRGGKIVFVLSDSTALVGDEEKFLVEIQEQG